MSSVENLFRPANGRNPKYYPDYGQYIPECEFKAFLRVLPYLWCDERFWYNDPRAFPWELMMPFIQGINGKRRELLKVLLMMLVETMWSWRPKTSATGGLPNITYEPRKLVNLDPMARATVEAITRIMTFQDAVVDLTSQRLKAHIQTDNLLHLPGDGLLAGARRGDAPPGRGWQHHQAWVDWRQRVVWLDRVRR